MDRLLRTETARVWTSIGASFVLGAVLSTLVFMSGGPLPPDRIWVASLIAWNVFTVTFLATTWLHFRELSGSELRGALLQDRAERGWWGRLLRVRGARTVLAGGDAPSFAAQVAFLALMAVGLLLLHPRLRGDSLVLAGAGLLVVGSWVMMLVAYAVHYARLDHEHHALTFPDDDEDRAFSDYVYIATSVQTTFGVTDLSVKGSLMRRTIVGHSLIAFMFNTVIIAMLVAAVITVLA